MNKPSQELKPCPFCGGDVSLQGNVPEGYWIECQCRNLMTSGRDEVIAAWNTRADSHRITELEAQLDKMAEAIQQAIIARGNIRDGASFLDSQCIISPLVEALAHYSEERAGENSKSSAGQFNLENQVK